MPISVYKELTEELKKEYGIGIMCPVPKYRDTRDEFKKPTPLDKTDIEWEMKILKPAKTKSRDKSLTELLFCMLRSGRQRRIEDYVKRGGFAPLFLGVYKTDYGTAQGSY